MRTYTPPVPAPVDDVATPESQKGPVPDLVLLTPDGQESNRFALAFGDFKRGYLIVDRVGIRMLRDPYSTKPYVLFYTTKRVGGGMQDFDAIKLMKFGVS